MNAFEPTEILLVGRYAGNELVKVKLNDLVAFTWAVVGNVTGNRNLRIGAFAHSQITAPCAAPRAYKGNGGWANSQIAVVKCRVTQAVAKVKERAVHPRLFSLPLRVGLRWEVVRNLPDSLWKRDGQFAAWVVIAKQHIGDCRSALGAGKPCLNNSGYIFVDPVDAHRPAINHDYNHGFPGGVHSLNEFELSSRQIQTSTRCGFPDGTRRVSQDHDSHIGLLCCIDCFRNVVLFLVG